MKQKSDIKYIITLDSDTSLSLNTAPKLIGAMSHILNLPAITEDKVIDGYCLKNSLFFTAFPCVFYFTVVE